LETVARPVPFTLVRACWLLLGLVLGASPFVSVEAASAKIIKVLPHYVDREGRIALSPSLFERDAYQALLRRDRNLCSGLRFDVQWKAKPAAGTLKLRLELVTPTVSRVRPLVLELPVRPKALGSRWSRVALEGEAFRTAGEVTAWRASLWNGDQLLAEQHSFLW
jgi:hypothetical protein